MNASGQVTPANAPRDVEKLQLLGPFMLKRLMEQGSPMVNVAFDEAQRNAFFKKPINERAATVLELLKQIDASGGGGGAPAVTPAPAAAPAAAAAPATEDKPARTPVSRKTNGAATNGASSNGASDDGLAILKGISAVLSEVSGTVEAMAKAVKAVETGSKKMGDLDEKLDAVIRMQHLTMGVLQQIVQNGGMNAPMADVLEAVKSEYGEIEESVSSLISGK